MSNFFLGGNLSSTFLTHRKYWFARIEKCHATLRRDGSSTKISFILRLLDIVHFAGLILCTLKRFHIIIAHNRKRIPLNALLFLSLSLLIVSCASTGSPSGGPKDTQAPEFVVEGSSPNFSTNYTPQKIELVFDEWIELKNQAKEILISPPFFKKPKITQRGKKVTVEFPEDEPLRPDATYTLNFGESIVDFTESNPVEGFRFLFATGDEIDSLTFNGRIVDAYGGDPIKDVLIMLYDVLGDSVVVSEKPFYYARASDEGEFQFENLKNDTFKLIVIEDLNLNYLLDDELERLAFIDSTFIVNDSTDFSPELRLFTPEQSTRIINSSSKVPGQITTVFNKKAEDVSYEFLYPQNFEPSVETIGDTVKYWFSDPFDSVGIIFGVDTLDFTIKQFDSLFYARKLVLKENNLIGSSIAPFDSLVLSFNAPLQRIDTSFITLSDRPKEMIPDTITNVKDTLGGIGQTKNIRKEDTLLVNALQDARDSLRIVDSLKVVRSTDSKGSLSQLGDSIDQMPIDTVEYYEVIDDIDVRHMILTQNWKEGHDYQLIILPGGVVDIYGRTCDTIRLNFKTSSYDEFGSINLTVSDIDSSSQYVVILRDGEKKKAESIIEGTSLSKITFSRLPMKSYNIHLIKDENRDGKWTTGDYWTARQPELLKKYELEELRENWDLEANISWEGIKKDTMGIGVDTSLIKLDSLDNPVLKGMKGSPKSPSKQKPLRPENNKSRSGGRKG